MNKKMPWMLGFSILPIVSGCGGARPPSRLDTTLWAAPVNPRVAAASERRDARLLPGEFEMDWSSPAPRTLPQTEATLSNALRAQQMARRGKLYLGPGPVTR